MDKEPKGAVSVLRWIAIIPGGFVASILALFPLHWVLYFTLVKGEIIQMPIEDMARIEQFLTPIICAIFFVYAGASIAPRKQLLVAYILFSFTLLARIALLLIMVSKDLEIDLSTYGILRFSLSALAGALSILLINLKTKKNL